MGDEEDPWGFDGGDDAPAPEPAAGTPAVQSVRSGTPGAASMTGAASVHGSAAGGSGGAGSAGGGSAGGGSAAAGSIAGDVAVEEAAAPPPPEDDGYRKPVQLYRHWVRPKFLQYKYMYNYRTNYYDDVIDYLDKKQVGVTREIPRPQTWAERVLRKNNTSGRETDAYTSSDKKDCHLMITLPASIRTHNYHTKAYINQRYASVL